MAVWVLLGTAFAAALVGYVPLGASHATDWPALCLGIAGIVSVALLPQRARLRAYSRWRLSWAWFAWVLSALVAAALAGAPFAAFFGRWGSHLGWITVVVFGFVVAAAVENGKSVRAALVKAAPAFLAAELLVAGLQYTSGAHPSGTTSNSSVLALFIVLLLPAVSGMTLSASGRTERRFGFVVIAFCLWVMFVGGARTGLVVAVAWLAVWALVLLRDRGWGWARVRWVAAGELLAVAAVAALAWTPLVSAVRGFAAIRGALWATALRATAASPVFGHGPDGFVGGSFSVTSSEVLWGAVENARVAVDPHNFALWVLVSTGVVGIALFAWLVFEVAVNWVQQRRHGGFAETWPWMAGVVLFAIACLATPASLQTLPLLALVAGASLRVPKSAEEAGARSVSVAVRVIAGLLSALLLVSAAGRLVIGRPGVAGGPAALTQRIADVWRIDPFLYWRASVNWAYAAEANKAVAEQTLSREAAARAAELEPGNPAYALEYARTLAHYGLPQDQVEAAFARAARLMPAYPDTWANLGQYRMALGDLPGARAALDRVEGLTPNAESLRVEALYWSAAGDEEKAAEFARRAQEAESAPAQTGGQ